MTEALIGDVPTEPKKVDPDAIGAPDEEPVVPILTEAQMEQLSDVELQVYLSALQAQDDRWQLFARQKIAVEMTKTVRCVLYGGAAGGGKTDLGCWHAYERCQAVPKMRILYLRTSFPELWRSAVVRTMEKYDPEVAEFNKNKSTWTFTNGSVLEFGYLKDDDDVYQYKSAEYDIIIMDEASEFSEFQWVYLMSRLRTTIEKRRLGSYPHMLLMTNPEGKGVAWLKRYFVLPTDYGKRTRTYLMQSEEKDSEISVAFVPARVTDNPYIDPDYRKALTRLPEVKRRQLLDGDWDTFEGMFFPELDDDVHVIEPFPIPHEWERIRGLDHGFEHPTACVWIAFDGSGSAYVYEEYERSKMLVTQNAKAILERDVETDPNGVTHRPTIRTTMADSAMWQRTGANQFTIAKQYSQAGLRLQKANKKRVDGWLRVREYLHVPDEPNAEPGLYIFSSCPRTLRCLKGLVRDDRPNGDPEDCLKQDDDLADALRYALMSRRRRAVSLHRDPYAHLDTATARAARLLADMTSRRRSVNRLDRMA